MSRLACVLFVIAGAFAPTHQQQYVAAQQQAAPPQYRQVTQAEFFAAVPSAAGGAAPVYQQRTQTAPQQFVYARPVPVQPQVQPQPLLSTVDRQIQKTAHHLGGPLYANQIQNLQLQQQAVQAQAQVQRNALRLASVPRAQPLQYQKALAATPKYVIRPQQQEQGEEQQLEPEQYDHNPSYQFGFDVKDDLYTNYQNRKEQREGNKITGSYSVVDSDGYIRTVTYTADPKEGFKAEVSRQPTDIVVKIPQPQPQFQQQGEQQLQHVRQAAQPQQIRYVQVPQQQSQQQPTEEQGQKQRIIYQYQ